jgi:LysM repeat protein
MVESTGQVAEFTVNHRPFNPIPVPMTVRFRFAPLLALCAMLLAAGCGGGGDTGTLGPETDDPSYQLGLRFKRQGRDNEALAAFLKTIDERGERAAPESHFEVGQIYLDYIKEPIQAIYHLQKYLELKPNSPEAPQVRELVKRAKRDFVLTFPGHVLEATPGGPQSDQIEVLRRENDELRAQLARLGGGGGTAMAGPSRMITVPDPVAQPNPPPATEPSPITAATPAPAVPDRRAVPAPVFRGTVPSTTARGAAATSKQSPTRPAAGGRTHTVAPKETLFSISKKYGVKMDDIVAANGLGSVNAPIKIGTVLKIP